MPIAINEQWCKKCLICVQMCPKNLIAADEQGYPKQTDPGACRECENCAWICPDFAIDMTEKEKE